MIRLSLLQFRAQAATAAAALAVFAVILAATAPHLFGRYDSSGIAACQAHGNCVLLATSFVNKLGGFYLVFYFVGSGFLLLVPAIIGTFWAAPLLTREFEAGTSQLAWTQSVTRTRWLAAKLGVGALAAMATAGLFSLLLTWWSGPVDTAAPFDKGNSITFLRLGFVLFPTRGVTPLGYAAFAFALGVTAGLLIRRTVPAMAATLAAFLFIQIAWPIWVRPHLIPPAHAQPAWHDRRLDPLHPEHRPGRPAVRRKQRQRLPGKHSPGMQQHAEQSPPQGRDRLPARRTLLGPPVG